MRRESYDTQKVDSPAAVPLIVLADFRASGQEHSEINRFFLHFYKVTLGRSVHLFAEREHADCLVESTPADFVGRFWKTFSTSRIRTVFLREVMSFPRLVGVICHARRRHAELLHILFLSHLAHLIARVTLKVLNPRCPVLLTLHGELESLLRNERSFWKADYWFPRSMLIQVENLHPIILGENIKEEIRRLGISVSNFVAIEHPYRFGTVRVFDKQPGATLRVGSIGLASSTKGSELLFALASRFQREIANGEISFCHVGRFHPNMSSFSSPDVSTVAQETFVDDAQYERAIAALDAVLFFYPQDHYRLTASGALFDVVRHNKRLITFSNSYFRWVLRKVRSNVLQYVHDVGEMEMLLREWLIRMPTVDEADPYRAVKDEHSVEAVENVMAKQLSSKLGIAVSKPEDSITETLVGAK
jgi:hypothetical protein